MNITKDNDKTVDDLVLDFYGDLLERIFTTPLIEGVDDRRRRNLVKRRAEELADAASKSLTLFLVKSSLDPKEAGAILEGLEGLPEAVNLETVAQPNVNPESLAKTALDILPPPATVTETGHDAEYRVSLAIVMQVLTLLGPVMLEWRKSNLSSMFEVPRAVTNHMNRISEKLYASLDEGSQAADEDYEITYRDYLSQRFHRIEAGTVRMTTNMWVGLDELFVMPKVQPRPARPQGAGGGDTVSLMDLAAARAFFQETQEEVEAEKEPPTAINQIMESARTVIVGAPGSGKSTFLEWLQLNVATVDVEFPLGGQQAIPLMLRLREMDVEHLPRGLALIERATGSADRASLMPQGWIDRQMKEGRVLFMVDGLDETEPELRDKFVIPWIEGLVADYPDCCYVVTSRPTGYPAGTLAALHFTECDLLDFDPGQMAEYTRHWCTAIRLAQNEPEEEARREGEREGGEIVGQFETHSYIRNLARNPLMLSAICLVNYFEHGELPNDRARLYKLCVEGLVHNWDQRRGIHSDFSLDEKLQVCREVAISMQADDLAEIEVDSVRLVFESVLDDEDRAGKLLEHIRRRSGLLVERRAGVFAFAHLTFQEYLAACAVHEGNRSDVTPETLVAGHEDGRWNEVIALYCGVVPLAAKKSLLEALIGQGNTVALGDVLADAYFASGNELARDKAFRVRVLERIAVSPFQKPYGGLSRFPDAEAAPIANEFLCRLHDFSDLSHAYAWLVYDGKYLDTDIQIRKLENFKKLNPFQLCELIHVLHKHADSEALISLFGRQKIYDEPGPTFSSDNSYPSQAFIALYGLTARSSPCAVDVYSMVFECMARTKLRKATSIRWFMFAEFYRDMRRDEKLLGLLDDQSAARWRGWIGKFRANITEIQGLSDGNRYANTGEEEELGSDDPKRVIAELREFESVLEKIAAGA